MAVYDFGYGVRVDDLRLRDGIMSLLLNKYGNKKIRNEYRNEDGEYEFDGNRWDCIANMLNAQTEKYSDLFFFDDNTLYASVYFPETAVDRAKVPTAQEIRQLISRFVNEETLTDDSGEIVFRYYPIDDYS